MKVPSICFFLAVEFVLIKNVISSPAVDSRCHRFPFSGHGQKAPSVLSVSCSRRTSSPTPPSSMVSGTVIVPRGGALSSLDPETVAKAMTVAASAQGFVMNTGPKLSNEMYGFATEDNDPFAQFLAGQFGAGILSYGILLYCMLFQGTSLATANQAVYAFWIYQNVRMMLSGTLDTLTINLNGIILSVAVFVAAYYAMTKEDLMTISIKILGVFWSIDGLQMILSPDSAFVLWKFDKEKLSTDTTRFLMRLFGYFLLAFSAYNMSIVCLNATPIQATGYGSIVWAMLEIVGLLNGDFKLLGIHRGSQVFWLLFHLIVIAATLS